MKKICRGLGVCAILICAVCIGNFEAWGQTCSSFQVQGKGETIFYADPDLFPPEMVAVLNQCFEPEMVANFNYCFTFPSDYVGSAYGCGNWTWYLNDPFGVGYQGTIWMNPVAYDLPDGIICAIEQSVTYWSPQFGMVAALQQIVGGTGIYENAFGWLTSNPAGRVAAPSGIGRMDGWLCTP